MTHAVIGLFDNRTDAQTAMSELVKNGFLAKDIDLSNKVAGSGTLSSNETAGDADGSIGTKVMNFFNSIFGENSPEAYKYSTVASDTEAILTVQTPSKERAEVASDILDNNGAVDVDERMTKFGDDTSSRAEGQKDSNRGRIDIPVIEEDFQVGKRAVERGGVKVKSRIIQKPIEKNIRLREEHVVVRRDPVNQVVSANALDNFREGEFEITEHAEEAVVAKQARVKENVSIDKTVDERDETVRDTVRRTEVEVNRTKGGNRAEGADANVREDARSMGAGR